MKKLILFFSLMVLLFLVACRGGGNATEAGATEGQTEAGGLTTDYRDALSVQGQLALGTVQLEETDLAVTEAQAAELLPLWQALQSLINSDTTAPMELEAVVKQISNAMTGEQIAAIAALELTTDSLTELQESGALAFGGRNASQDGSDEEFAFPGGGFAGGPPGGGGGFAGGPPVGGGDFAGGAPGAAAGITGEVDEDAMATRQAEFESGDFQERMLLNFVIRLLGQKTGQVFAGPGNFNQILLTTLSESLDLTIEELQAQMTEGQTPAEIIEANGGDAAAIQSELVAALGETELPGKVDAAAFVEAWLQGNMGGDSPPTTEE
jgi:hypothetical protein